MIGRRAFLRRAIAAGVVAAVAPSVLVGKQEALSVINPFALGGTLPPLPDSVFVDTPLWTVTSNPGPITPGMIEQMYLAAMGRDGEPNVGFMHPRYLRLCRKLAKDPRYSDVFCVRTVSDPWMSECEIPRLSKMPHWFDGDPVKHA